MDNVFVVAMAAGTFIGSLIASIIASRRVQQKQTGESALIGQRQETQQVGLDTLRREFEALRVKYEMEVAALRANVALVTELFEKSVEKRTLQNMEIEALRREVANLTEQVAELETRDKGKEVRLATQITEIASLKAIIEKQKHEIDRLNTERGKVEELLAGLRTELTDYKALAVSRQEELEKIRKEADHETQPDTGNHGKDLPESPGR